MTADREATYHWGNCGNHHFVQPKTIEFLSVLAKKLIESSREGLQGCFIHGRSFSSLDADLIDDDVHLLHASNHCVKVSWVDGSTAQNTDILPRHRLAYEVGYPLRGSTSSVLR